MSYITNNNKKKTDGKVLLVEDENLIGWSIATALRREGYAVTLVESGEEALEIISSTTFDIVITDFKLPHINGMEVAIRVKFCSQKVPVIMISSLEESQIGREQIKKNIDLYLEKPFPSDELTNIVNRFIKQSFNF